MGGNQTSIPSSGLAGPERNQRASAPIFYPRAQRRPGREVVCGYTALEDEIGEGVFEVYYLR